MRTIMRRMPWKIRYAASLLVSLVPFNTGRVLLHRLINGYHISWSARIGFGTVLAIDNADIGGAIILRFNTFQGPFSLTIEDGAVIGPSNRFMCLFGATKKDRNGNLLYPNRHCILRANSHVTERHYIDTTGGFELGARSWIAGSDTQIWTHGIKNQSVVIGSDCYVSSAARFAPGAQIGDHVLVGLASVVTGEFESHVMIAGAPAKVIRAVSAGGDSPQP